MIVYFKLNINLVKKFLEKEKIEEIIKLKNKKKICLSKIPNIEKTIKYKKEEKIANSKLVPPLYLEYLNLPKVNKTSNSGKIFNTEKKINDGSIKPPVYLKYSNIIIKNELKDIGLKIYDKFGESDNALPNPNKKDKRNNKLFNNILSTKNVISTRKI